MKILPALIRMKCPQCRQGKVFKFSNPYNLKHVGDMFSLCPVCNLNYKPEPGFYFGGAVVSYPLMVIFNLFVVFIFYLLVGGVFDYVLPLMVTVIIATLLVSPIAFRYSRIIFLYLVVRYKK